MRITFIGLGMMGRPMAENLLKAGFDLTVVNRSQAKVAELAAKGAHAGTTPAAASAGADVVCLCLLEDGIVEAVLSGPEGVLATARPGTVVLDHSTVHPQFAARMAEACAAGGVTYLDAPVSGTGQVAWDGQLTVMAGGDGAALERVRPVLEAVAVNIRHMGPVGTGNMAKLINNMVKDVNQLAVMEALALGAGLGMDLDALFAVMRTASAASRQLERVAPKILDGSFTQTTYINTNIKDMALMAWLTEQGGVRLALRETAAAYWERAVAAGLGESDPSRVITLLEAETGTPARSSPGKQ